MGGRRGRGGGGRGGGGNVGGGEELRGGGVEGRREVGGEEKGMWEEEEEGDIQEGEGKSIIMYVQYIANSIITYTFKHLSYNQQLHDTNSVLL